MSRTAKSPIRAFTPVGGANHGDAKPMFGRVVLAFLIVSAALALPFVAKSLWPGEHAQWARLLSLAPILLIFVWWEWREFQSCEDDSDLSVEMSLALTGAP
jgi:hypothetical protein